MNDLHAKAVLAGLFFGIWPLFMNRSGLNGNVSSVCFSVVVLIGVLPAALYSNGLSIPVANWAMVVLAGIFGALGLVFFNMMLAGASPQNVGTLFVIVTILQIVVASLYHTTMNGHLSFNKVCGYITAVLATYLLLR